MWNNMPRKKKVLKGVRKTRTLPAWVKQIPPAQLAALRQQYAMSGAGQSGGSFLSWLKKTHDWIRDRRILSTAGRLAEEVFPNTAWLREGTDFLQNRGYGRQRGGAIMVSTGNNPGTLRFR